MNKQWSEAVKNMQEALKKQDTYEEGIAILLSFRAELYEIIEEYKLSLRREDFDAMPFMNHKGYVNKNIAYSLYHVFRIEDIVCNTLIQKKEEVFFKKDYQRRMNAPIITTGNELVKQQIAEFSSKLNLEELYNYITDVYEESNNLLRRISFNQLKEKMTEEDKIELRKLQVVSEEENAIWLIDYWCNKNVKGLLQMPFSRHWIMHIEAANKIAEKVKKGR